jgi:hypothetical protein
MEIVEEHLTGSQHQMPVDQHAGVILLLGQAQDLPPDLSSLVELGAEIVETGQAAQNGAGPGVIALRSKCPSEDTDRVGVEDDAPAPKILV